MTNKTLKLYRKRIIPEEMILLKDDIVLHQDTSIIITKLFEEIQVFVKEFDFFPNILLLYLAISLSKQ